MTLIIAEVPEHHLELMTKLLNNKIFPVRGVRVDQEVGTGRVFIEVFYNFHLSNGKNNFRHTMYVSSVLLEDTHIDMVTILFEEMIRNFGYCSEEGTDGFSLEDADILNSQYKKYLNEIVSQS